MRVDETYKKFALVQEQLDLVKVQLATVLEKQVVDTSIGTSHVHPHYDEDLDDQPIP